MKPKTRWVPKVGEMYWGFLGDDFGELSVVKISFNGNEASRVLVQICGFGFRTKKEAMAKLREIRRILKNEK